MRTVLSQTAMQQRHVKHPFGAVVDSNSKVLILGSVPSLKSVENNFFYMHPHNRFWRVLSLLFGEDFYSATIGERKRFLLKHRIALYDSVEECDILGSSDAHISNVIYADIPSLLNNSQISHIFCNGKASYTYLTKGHPSLTSITTLLPSTSPANAAYSLDRLTNEWKVIKKYLDD